MAGYHFCTIATPDFLAFTEAMYQSLVKQSPDTYLHILVTDGQRREARQNCRFYNLDDICNDHATIEIIHKYRSEPDLLRWALKPSFLLHLLQHQPKVFYADNDLFFFNSFAFLFDMLDECSLLLSPHWCSFDPLRHGENFRMHFQSGLFNAGLVGVTKEVSPFLDWWRKVCLYKMSSNTGDGFFVDQRYLDVAPLLNEKTKIIRHLGCNVGSWNMHQNIRVNKNGAVFINGEYPIIFIHFNGETITHIMNGNDGSLMPYLHEFRKAVEHAGGDIFKWKKVSDITHTTAETFKRKLMIRTRLKNWLYYLSQKL